MLYAAVQLALLTHSARNSSGASSHAILEASLSLCASLGLIWVSKWAHDRSVCPSSLTTVYLMVKLLCCSLWIPVSGQFRDGLSAYALPCSTLLLLVLESHDKTSILLPAYTIESPEAMISFLGNMLFWWINPILARGYSRLLSADDIPCLDQNTSSKALAHAILLIWDQRGTWLASNQSFENHARTQTTARPENGATLPLVLLRCLFRPFLGAITSRILVIIFRFSQPLLISRAIQFVTDLSVGDDYLDGYWIIVAAAATYIGMAVSF